jgi:GH15 family glucan-1,4-alpha-glucosidase
MYGLAGERRLEELELPWLAGYENSRPVRIGNAASDQLQLDVYGELMDSLHVARKFELPTSKESWNFQKALLANLAKKWQRPDKGIWEVRGGSKPFTHSRLMAWVAYDRAVKAVEDFGLSGPVEDWRALRATIKADILRHGWSDRRRSFVQSYGDDALDASLLLLPLVGFLPPEDPRLVSTIDAIQRELTEDGLLLRYRRIETDDGLAGREGTFLVCSFWLADALCMIGRLDEAADLFERLLSLVTISASSPRSDDPIASDSSGTFPRALFACRHRQHRSQPHLGARPGGTAPTGWAGDVETPTETS